MLTRFLSVANVFVVPKSAPKPTSKYKKLPGVRRFARFLRKKNVSYAVAAAALRVSGHTIWAWRNGVKLPSPTHQERIAIWTSGYVHLDDWKLESEAKITEEIRPYSDLVGEGESGRRTGTTA